MTDNIWIQKITELCAEYNVGVSSQMEDFFKAYADNDAPASTQHHLAKEFGNWEHIYNVCKSALMLNKVFNLGYSEYSIVKVCLCHDIEKFENKAVPNVLKSGKVSEAKPYVYPKEGVFLGHGVTSLIEGLKYFSMDGLEKQAVLMHMAMYSYELDTDTIKDRMTRFTKLIHFADDISASLIEESFQDKKKGDE